MTVWAMTVPLASTTPHLVVCPPTSIPITRSCAIICKLIIKSYWIFFLNGLFHGDVLVDVLAADESIEYHVNKHSDYDHVADTE